LFQWQFYNLRTLHTKSNRIQFVTLVAFEMLSSPKTKTFFFFNSVTTFGESLPVLKINQTLSKVQTEIFDVLPLIDDKLKLYLNQLPC
jgi:hypothetical protein